MDIANNVLKIAFAGAGNVAWHLSQAFTFAGHRVNAVYSRSETSRNDLASILPDARPLSLPDFTNHDVDILIIAVPDAALVQLLANLKVNQGTIIAHTSGSQPLVVLNTVMGAMPAVFYPLQTFSKSKNVDLKQVPILLEAEEEITLQKLEVLANSISQQVLRVNSDTRKELHLAAVFACNFTNHLLGISQQLLEEAKLPKNLLQPLIQETFAKALQHNPFQVQTGPAIRHDDNVIKAHLDMLSTHPAYKELYQKLTESIQAVKV